MINNCYQIWERELGKVTLKRGSAARLLKAMHSGSELVTFTPEGYSAVASKRRRTVSASVVNQTSEVVNNLQLKVDELEKQLSECLASNKAKDRKIEQLEAELAASGRASNLFKRTSKSTRRMSTGNSSGKVLVYGNELNALAVACIAEGIPAAHVKRVLDALAYVCDLLLTEDHRVPNSDWFVKKRLELKSLNDRQLISFVNDSDYLTVSFDETSMHANKIGCLGLTNHLGEYMAASFDLVMGRKGVELAADMFNAIDKMTTVDENGVTLATLIRRKVVALMTDRSRVQECGNRHFVQLMNSHNDRIGMDALVTLVCLMHTASNAEKYFTGELNADTLRMFALIRRIFGCRQSSAYNKHGLTYKLARLTGTERTYESTIGTRFGTFNRNGRALLQYEGDTKRCLANRREGQTVTTLQRELIDIMNDPSWPRIKIEAGMFMSIWLFALESFHASMSRPNLTFGEARVEMKLCLLK